MALDKSDCCSTTYDFNGSYWFSNCTTAGVCGGIGAICGQRSHCVSGRCYGHRGNVAPVQLCTTSADCSGPCIESYCRE